MLPLPLTLSIIQSCHKLHLLIHHLSYCIISSYKRIISTLCTVFLNLNPTTLRLNILAPNLSDAAFATSISRVSLFFCPLYTIFPLISTLPRRA